MFSLLWDQQDAQTDPSEVIASGPLESGTIPRNPLCVRGEGMCQNDDMWTGLEGSLGPCPAQPWSLP